MPPFLCPFSLFLSRSLFIYLLFFLNLFLFVVVLKFTICHRVRFHAFTEIFIGRAFFSHSFFCLYYIHTYFDFIAFALLRWNKSKDKIRMCIRLYLSSSLFNDTTQTAAKFHLHHQETHWMKIACTLPFTEYTFMTNMDKNWNASTKNNWMSFRKHSLKDGNRY